jgi:rhomboid protease GluP
MDSYGAGEGSAHGGTRMQPEILPPASADEQTRRRYAYARMEQGGAPPPPPRPRRPNRWSYAPATYVLVGINCLVFLGMVLNGVSIVAPGTEDLWRWGANNGRSVLYYGQWWRLLTANFVHVGILHLATNMWCLWNLGLLGEPMLGPFGMVAIYVLTGISGNLLSTAVHPGVMGHPDIVGAGASGAVFGLAGVLIMLLNSPLLPVPRAELQRLRKSVIYFAVLNFVIGAGTLIARTSIQIDNMAHLGGFLSGLAMGVPLVPRIGAPRGLFVRRQWVAFVAMAAILLLGGVYLAHLYG